eukprot:scaffold2161_cov244-Pinguiococcus_pyrenoidosus.AAC.8
MRVGCDHPTTGASARTSRSTALGFASRSAPGHEAGRGGGSPKLPNSVRLLLGELGELHAQGVEVEARHLLVEVLRQDVDVAALVLAGLALVPELQLGQGLVREGVGHHEGRVAGGAAQVEQAALGEHDDAVAIREGELVDLRLDVRALGGGHEAVHVNFVVEVADVSHDGVVLHLRHVRGHDDALVSRGGDEDVGFRDDGLEADHAEPLHGGLQRADRVDLRHVHHGTGGLHGLGAAFAHVAEAADHDALAREHHVGGAHDTVRQGVLAAVQVVELGLGHGVVHVDGGEEQLALLLHLVQAVHARGGLLRDAEAARGHLVPALRVVGELAAHDGEHDLELGVVRAVRVREGAVLGEGLLGLVALVDEERHVTAVVHDDVRALALAIVLGPRARLQGAVPVLLEGLALPGEHGGGLVAGNGRGGVVLGGEDVATAPSDVSTERLERLDEHGGLNGHVQRPRHARAGQLAGELLAAGHQTGHLVLGELDLLATEVGQADLEPQDAKTHQFTSPLPSEASEACHAARVAVPHSCRADGRAANGARC